MLKKWMSSSVCENDPIKLLKLLDAESHPNVSEMALKALIETKAVKAMAYATKEKSESERVAQILSQEIRRRRRRRRRESD